MKNFYLFGVILFLLCSCAEADHLLEPQIQESQCELVPSVATNQDDVTIVEINNIIKAHGKARSRVEYATVSAIKGEDGETTLYVINYGDNEGWQIVSASKNVEPILAYSEEGYFDVNKISEMPIGLSNWIGNASIAVEQSSALDADSIAKVHAMWRMYESHQSLSRSETLIEDRPQDILKYISQEEYDKLMQIVRDSISSWERQGFTVQVCDKDFMAENPEIYDWALGTMHAPYTDAIDIRYFTVEPPK